MARTNFDHYIDYGDECCYDEQDCRLVGCGAKIAFGPGCAFADLANVPWFEFDIPRDLLSFDLETTADVENYRAIGSCDDKCKVTGRHWSISGSMYWCRSDVAQCRVCLEGSCVSFCYAPCGLGYAYDPAGDGDPSDDDGSGQVNPDIIVNNTTVIFGTGVVNSCSTSVQPDDYITSNFSITGCGRLYRENMCQAPQLAPTINQEAGIPLGATAEPGLQRNPLISLAA